MSIALRRPMLVDAFLDWEREQDKRYEFGGMQPVPMVMNGAMIAHGLIVGNTFAALRSQLTPPCRAFSSGIKLVWHQTRAAGPGALPRSRRYLRVPGCGPGCPARPGHGRRGSVEKHGAGRSDHQGGRVSLEHVDLLLSDAAPRPPGCPVAGAGR